MKMSKETNVKRFIQLNTDVQELLKTTFVNDRRVDELGTQCCEEHFIDLLCTLATPPGYSTLRVNTQVGSVTETLQVVEETLKQDYSRKGWELPVIELHPLIPDVLMIKNRGPVENLQHHNKEIVVDLFCGMAVLRGADVFAQGIMGCHSGVRKGDEVSVYADLDGSCLKGLSKPYTGCKVFVGNGLARVGRDELFCAEGTNLSGIGVEMTAPLYQAPCLADTLLERVFAQNLPSIVCGHVLDPKPGELILDMCAAPGGKTTHLACLMKNKGRVVALDKSPQKVEKIHKNCQRWGLSCVEGYAWDASKALCKHADAAPSSRGPPFPARTFDRVLVDAPCSALGQRPSFRNKMTAKELKSYPKYQRKILAVAIELVKVDGVLVYSTCSLPFEENEGQVEWVLKNYPELELEKQTPCVGQPGLRGTGLSSDQLQLLQRFDPAVCVKTHSDWNTDTIGFFIAKFRRKE